MDFCIGCGCWIAANKGTMREASDGGVEIICDECLAIENRAAAFVHDAKSGMLGDV